MTETFDPVAVGTHAIAQARLLKSRATMAADTAIQMAVTLLLDAGMSQREVARISGVSKSSVARAARTRPALTAGIGLGVDARVHSFSDEWIWGGAGQAEAVRDALVKTAAGIPFVRATQDVFPKDFWHSQRENEERLILRDIARDRAAEANSWTDFKDRLARTLDGTEIIEHLTSDGIGIADWGLRVKVADRTVTWSSAELGSDLSISALNRRWSTETNGDDGAA